MHVDGRRVTIASQRLRDGQTMSLAPGSPALVREATEIVGRVPGWLEADHDRLSGRVLRAPRREKIAIPVAEQLVASAMRAGEPVLRESGESPSYEHVLCALAIGRRAGFDIAVVLGRRRALVGHLGLGPPLVVSPRHESRPAGRRRLRGGPVLGAPA